MAGNNTPMNLWKNQFCKLFHAQQSNEIKSLLFFTYRNDANSIGLMSTSSLTMTEHREKKNEDNVASIIPKNGQA